MNLMPDIMQRASKALLQYKDCGPSIVGLQSRDTRTAVRNKIFFIRTG